MTTSGTPSHDISTARVRARAEAARTATHARSGGRAVKLDAVPRHRGGVAERVGARDPVPRVPRRVIYTTNAIEAGSQPAAAQALKTKGSLPNEDAARKLVYRALQNAVPQWTRTRNWMTVLLGFKIHFGDRVPDTANRRSLVDTYGVTVTINQGTAYTVARMPSRAWARVYRSQRRDTQVERVDHRSATVVYSRPRGWQRDLLHPGAVLARQQAGALGQAVAATWCCAVGRDAGIPHR